jgi:hypothetical protein
LFWHSLVDLLWHSLVRLLFVSPEDLLCFSLVSPLGQLLAKLPRLSLACLLASSPLASSLLVLL